MGKKGQSFSAAEIEDIVISNALLLFFAGNDTTAAAITSILYFMAMNPEAQEKLYQEISDCVDENEGNLELNHEELFGMKFMGQVIKESLRFWAFNFMDRVCVKDYYLEKTQFVITKGTTKPRLETCIYRYLLQEWWCKTLLMPFTKIPIFSPTQMPSIQKAILRMKAYFPQPISPLDKGPGHV